MSIPATERTLNAPEMRDALHRRDVQEQTVAEVRHTDPDAWLADLAADKGELFGPVRLAIVSGPATVAQVNPGRAFDTRDNPLFASRYVRASYTVRRELVILSAFCGVIFKADPLRPGNAETEQRLSAAMRKVQRGIYLLELETRGGGLYVPDEEAWQAHPDQRIDTPPEPLCLHCGIPIHWASGHWRDDQGRFEVLRSKPGRYGLTTELEHEHEPEVAS